VNALFSPRAQLIIGWVLLIGSVIAWPLSQLTVAQGEPPFVLGLSWLAVVLNAWGIIVACQINKDVDDVEGELSPKSLEQIEEVVIRAIAQGSVRGSGGMAAGAALSAKEGNDG
jgi:hypothetical protein